MSCAKTESPINFIEFQLEESSAKLVEQNVIGNDDEKTSSSQKECANDLLPMLDYSCRRCQSCKKIKPPASFFFQKASGKIARSKVCSICRKKSRQSVKSVKSASSDSCEKKHREIKGLDTPFSVILPAGHADISDADIDKLSKITPNQIGMIGDSVKIADINNLFNIYSMGYTNLSMMYNADQYFLYLSFLNQMNQLSYISQYPIMTPTAISQNQQVEQQLQHLQQPQPQPIVPSPVKDEKSPVSPSSTIIGVINSNVDFTVSFTELKCLIPEDVYNGLKKEHQTQLTIYSNNPQTVFKLLPSSVSRKNTLLKEIIKFYELLTLTITCTSCKETVPKMYCFIHKDNFICRECSLRVESHELLDWNCDNNIENNENRCFTIQCVRCKHSICYHKYLKYNRNGEIKRQNTCSYCRLKQWRDYYLGISNNGNGSILSNE